MYDSLSANYDRFVDWQGRLALELPFIIEKLQAVPARRVLDAASGTGMHAIALAQCGFNTAGADNSQGMIERARQNASLAGVQVRFEQARLGDLCAVMGRRSWEAVMCLGNSLPHLLTQAELAAALIDFSCCLNPGGALIIQNRNFDAIMTSRERWMEPQAHTEGQKQWIFQRFYDFDPDGLITFNMVTLEQEGLGSWSQSVSSSRLRPLLKDELVTKLGAAGFGDITAYGNMSGADFDPRTSPNLVVTARMS